MSKSDGADGESIRALREKVSLLKASLGFGCDSDQGKARAVASYTPGRVNLIGEHTDYQDGLVFPFAINKGTLIWLSARPLCSGVPRFRVHSDALSQTQSFDDALPSKPPPVGDHSWWVYFIGPIVTFIEHLESGAVTPCPPVPSGWLKPMSPSSSSSSSSLGDMGFDAIIVTDLYIGAGLSASAALMVGTVTAMESLCGVDLPPLAKMETIAQQAEHKWAHVPCGLMDQAVVTLAKRDTALLFDCRDKEGRHFPLPSNDVAVVVFDSGVKHRLVDGEYKQRRNDCEKAVDILKECGHPEIKALRDVNLDMLDQSLRSPVVCASSESSTSSGGCPVWHRRASHVVNENRRCTDFSAALTNGQYEVAGELMRGSHESLRDLFETSTKHIDQLVHITQSFAAVYGARITGGGFGGCVVALCQAKEAENVKNEVLLQYHKLWLSEQKDTLTKEEDSKQRELSVTPPRAFIALPCDGSRRLTAPTADI